VLLHYESGTLKLAFEQSKEYRGWFFQMAKTSFKRRAATAKPKNQSIDVTYKQGLFIQCDAKLVLYGGAAGG
jgi:uncharacterized protein YfaT (DUF1175 family)